MLSFLSKALTAILICIASFSASAQFRQYGHAPHRAFNIKDYTESPRFFQRVYVVFSKPFMPSSMTYNYVGRDYYGKRETEHVEEKMPQKKNYGLGFGTFIPLGRLGAKSKICLSVDFMMNTYMWKDEKEVVNTSYLGTFQGQSVTTTMVAGVGDMAMPLTLDYRTGCDVMLSKEMPTCFAFGVGAYPSFRVAKYYALSETKLGVHPVVKMEFGFRAGMCFKVRAMYEMGKTTYIDYQESGGEYYNESLVLESKGNFILSLLVVPTAFSWGKDR